MSLRMLAPAALVLFTVILLILVVSSGGGDGGGSSPATKEQTTNGAKSRSAKRGTSPTSRSVPRVYVVKPGDTLGGIAASTGVGIDELMSLNPEVDPRTLVTGQRLKLRQ
jgi:LysM repeat protein